MIQAVMGSSMSIMGSVNAVLEKRGLKVPH